MCCFMGQRYPPVPELGSPLGLHLHPSQYECSKRDKEPRFLLPVPAVLSLIAWAHRCCSTFCLRWVNYSNFKGHKCVWQVSLERKFLQINNKLIWLRNPGIIQKKNARLKWSGNLYSYQSVRKWRVQRKLEAKNEKCLNVCSLKAKNTHISKMLLLRDGRAGV